MIAAKDNSREVEMILPKDNNMHIKKAKIVVKETSK